MIAGVLVCSIPFWLKAALRQQGDEGSGEYRMAGSNYTSVQ